MKFTIAREALLKPLNLVAGVVERRHADVSSMCKGRPLYECNDSLMSVWLRLLKNPDYSNE